MPLLYSIYVLSWSAARIHKTRNYSNIISLFKIIGLLLMKCTWNSTRHVLCGYSEEKHLASKADSDNISASGDRLCSAVNHTPSYHSLTLSTSIQTSHEASFKSSFTEIFREMPRCFHAFMFHWPITLGRLKSKLHLWPSITIHHPSALSLAGRVLQLMDLIAWLLKCS